MNESCVLQMLTFVSFTCKQEFRLMMLRHWSLYNSMYNSPHVATRLVTWTSAGKEKLDFLLARMGCVYQCNWIW